MRQREGAWIAPVMVVWCAVEAASWWRWHRHVVAVVVFGLLGLAFTWLSWREYRRPKISEGTDHE